MPRGSVRAVIAAGLAAALVAGMTIGWWMRGPSGAGESVSGRDERSSAPVNRRATGHDAASRFLGRERSGDDEGGLLREIEALAAESPVRAQAELAHVGDDADLRAMAHAALSRGWAAKDPAAAAAWVESLADEEDQISASLGLVPEWASQDPDACMDWCRGLSQGALRELSLVGLADAWVERDPQAAFRGFTELADEDGRERGLHAICSEWALADPDSALRHLGTLDPVDRRDEFLESALVSLSNEDPERSWRQADMVPERAGHIRAMALEAIAESNPQRALSMAGSVKQVPAEWWRAIGRGWAYEDARGATAWARSIEDPELRTLVLEEVEAAAE